MKITIRLLCMLLSLLSVNACSGDSDSGGNPPKEEKKSYNNFTGIQRNMADPFVLQYGGKYYLYGTADENSEGFKVHVSEDMVNWSEACGATNGWALHRNDVWGDKWFWGPEVVYYKNKFYMLYSVEEHIAVATSDSPLGPFIQQDKRPIHPDTKEIDQSVLFDDDGKIYIYFVRFDNGNVTYGAEMNDDLTSVKESTITRLIDYTEAWEHTPNNENMDWPVTEAPFIMKHKGYYYLFYTANDFRNPDYAVGYAVSESPLGPFTKYDGNPVLKSTTEQKGTGTSSIVKSPDNSYYMVYHSHNNKTTVLPRKTCMDRLEFIPSGDGKPDIVKIYGPTVTEQEVSWK
ncbi:beta-xylosidase [Dysgonomonas sp. PFB1-18]|uniref:glycoside hydrolase family 43 protein n=1 Tax=unclassified Dysgonomonas TaxID=2630389 RepID=UPI0024759A1B|nr:MULTISPECIES: glycoside hydrolase family 43 protein [unclassified Dysgonomonas]MDL2303070.1 glycoside hydrolase family 43 protein [Dysgonomonas sp. OttesenSCG-928-D17]MDH6307533.1 beta-xylosidase [Dysgonomonas sp. PF1-14]MDH6337451.1 beta-xylosidase [Dysgonomonas sp. PF1-16]MDH6379375.1 beta-xylosidase [Dysgonomonas sp. PFB1-18]MDH6395987.1 beta-xylosidase [Dysgonomonas sp. PF1-23]